MSKLTVFALSIVAAVGAAQAANDQDLPPVEVHGPVVCLACIEWAEHLRQNGFKATFKGIEDMPALKRKLRVPADVESVLTATVAGYFIEGHVPAEDIKRLLKEKPKARGLAVPGLPMGAPGYESMPTDASCETGCIILDSGGGAERPPRREAFNTLLVAPDGKTSIYGRH